MQALEVPAFDCLRGDASPSTVFGPALTGAALQRAQSVFTDSSFAATERIASGFGVNLEQEHEIAGVLDQLVAGMWNSGWDPSVNDINLYATDFGLLFSSCLLQLSNSTLTIRSTSILDHCSIWFGYRGHEYFPFHKAMKCLTRRHGESFDSMFRAAEHSSGND